MKNCQKPQTTALKKKEKVPSIIKLIKYGKRRVNSIVLHINYLKKVIWKVLKILNEPTLIYKFLFSMRIIIGRVKIPIKKIIRLIIPLIYHHNFRYFFVFFQLCSLKLYFFKFIINYFIVKKNVGNKIEWLKLNGEE